MKIVLLVGSRAFIGEAWMAFLHGEIRFVPRLRENQYGGREGFEPWPIAALARHLEQRPENDPRRGLLARPKRAGVVAIRVARDPADRRGRTGGAGLVRQAHDALARSP